MDPEVKKGLYLILIGFFVGLGFIFGAILAFVFRHGFDFVTAFQFIFGWAFLVLVIGTLIVLLFQFLDQSVMVGGGYLCVVFLLGIIAVVAISAIEL